VIERQSTAMDLKKESAFPAVQISFETVLRISLVEELFFCEYAYGSNYSSFIE
jgi:hypothetical protein